MPLISYNLITAQHFRLHFLPWFKCVCHLQRKKRVALFMLVVLDPTVDLTNSKRLCFINKNSGTVPVSRSATVT